MTRSEQEDELKIAGLIDAYVTFRVKEYELLPARAVREIAMLRIGLEFKATPLSHWPRFAELAGYCSLESDVPQAIDVAIVEACCKYGFEYPLNKDIYLSHGVVSKINAFSKQQAYCLRRGKPLSITLDMRSIRWLSDIAFQSFIYCIALFQPDIKVTGLFHSTKNTRQKQLISQLPDGLNLTVCQLKSTQLLDDEKAMLWQLIASAAKISLLDCQLGRWSSQDIAEFMATIEANRYLEVLDLRSNQLINWADPRFEDKFEALQRLFRLPYLREINLKKNYLYRLTKEERNCLREAIAEGYQAGLEKVCIARCLQSGSRLAKKTAHFFAGNTLKKSTHSEDSQSQYSQ